MRKIFIDCGYNMGDVTSEFRNKLGDSFEYYAFEANPYLYEKYKNKHDFLSLQSKAVWIADGQIPFYVVVVDRNGNDNKYTGASTLIKEKSNWNMSIHQREEEVLVECIDFSKFLSDNFEKTDYIIVKMDIEGAEYEILNKLIEIDTADFMNEIYVEFHDEKVGLSKDKIISDLEKLNIKVHKWH